MVRSSVYVELASELEITKALTFLKLMDIPKVMYIQAFGAGGSPVSSLAQLGLGTAQRPCLPAWVPFLFPLSLLGS